MEINQVLNIKKEEGDRIIALAGNPNVGKSTVFNQLTGLKQHTGNWPGKTVTNALGYYTYKENRYIIVDIPGSYSLMAHSAEEEVARDFICFENPDAVVVVCDATCLERNFNLVLQILEVTSNVVVCINLMDEAAKKHIYIDFEKISQHLGGVPVVGTSARSNEGLHKIFESLDRIADSDVDRPVPVIYPDYIENAILNLEPLVKEVFRDRVNTRWMCARLLDANENLVESIERHFEDCMINDIQISNAISEMINDLDRQGYTLNQIRDDMASAFIKKAEGICSDTVVFECKSYASRDRKLDRLLTSKFTGIPIMFIGLLFVFWLTIVGANYPSELLSNLLFWIEERFVDFFVAIGAPVLLYEILVFGVYRVLAWVVAVMLPPMAIFFPLFTLMEDSGYLPRVAFNLDKCFKKCCACGKQALTMAMGFGCNAAGVIGCRIIDSERERLIAIITNNFVPCNGRFAPPVVG